MHSVKPAYARTIVETRMTRIEARIASHPLAETARRTMLFREIVGIAVDSFRTSKVRFLLTALGMVIGTASLIIVVTIGLTGKQYALNQIQSIGANMVVAYWKAEGTRQ